MALLPHTLSRLTLGGLLVAAACAIHVGAQDPPGPGADDPPALPAMELRALLHKVSPCPAASLPAFLRCLDECTAETRLVVRFPNGLIQPCFELLSRSMET